MSPALPYLELIFRAYVYAFVELQRHADILCHETADYTDTILLTYLTSRVHSRPLYSRPKDCPE